MEAVSSKTQNSQIKTPIGILLDKLPIRSALCSSSDASKKYICFRRFLNHQTTANFADNYGTRPS
jgi:hypothetical protein